MRRTGFLILVIVAAMLLAWAVFVFGVPRLESFSPADSALDVPAGSTFTMTFSRAMQPESVQEHLTIEPAASGSYQWDDNTLTFTPDESWPAGKVITVRLASGARASGFPALSLTDETVWRFTVRQPHLLYLFPSIGAANIYSLDPQTGEAALLTQISQGVREYDVNGSGSTLYFSVPNAQGGSDIYSQAISNESDSPSPDLLLDCQQAQCRAPRISPGEDYLAYERIEPPGKSGTGYPQVWVLPLTSRKPRIDQQDPSAAPFLAGEPLNQTIQPDWSPNGLVSFYDSNRQAFIVISPESGERAVFTNQTGEPGTWNSSGDSYVAPEIFFNAGGEGAAPALASSQLMGYHLASEKVEDLTRSEKLEDTSPVFSPDGSLLAFARKHLDIQSWTPGRQLWLMGGDGSNPRPLTDAPDYNHFDFAWAPGGDQLAFVRFDQTAPTNLPEIWIVDLISGLQTQWIEGGYAPHWIP